MTIEEKNSIPSPILIDPRVLNNYQDHDDEIDLVDLWLLLAKKKTIIMITTLISAVFAFIYTQITPSVYAYKTSVSIGTQLDSQLISSPEAVLADLNNAIIPSLLAKHHPDNTSSISVSIPKNSNSILLTSKDSFKQQESIATLHQQVVNHLAKSHNKRTQSIRHTLSEELAHTQKSIASLEQKSQALQLISTDSESISLQIINLENSIMTQGDNVLKIKRAISELSSTYSPMGTVKSIKSTSNNRMILIVSLFIGLFLGLFFALFSNFIAKVKEKSRKFTPTESLL